MCDYVRVINFRIIIIILLIPAGRDCIKKYSLVVQGRNHVFKVGGQFLGLGYYYPFTEKIRQVYLVWCSRLHNHTLFIKKLCKKLGGVLPNFWGRDLPTSPVVAPMLVDNIQRLITHCLTGDSRV